MTLSYLKDKIEQYTAFQRIPIELKVDSKTIVLHKQELKREEAIRYIKGIYVINLDYKLMDSLVGPLR